MPLSVILTIFIARRSQKEFAAQWQRTGALNGHVEEMHTGHAIVKVFGRQEEAIARFETENERALRGLAIGPSSSPASSSRP